MFKTSLRPSPLHLATTVNSVLILLTSYSQNVDYVLEIITLRALRRSFAGLREEYGLLQAVLLVFVFPDARDVLKRIEAHLLKPASDDKSAMDEAYALKKSLADDCTMLAVAAAIVAQIAITALSLDNLSSAHWTAKAAFVMSLASGALSVFFACLLQQRISSLFGLSELKDWLSKPTEDQRLEETADFVRHYARMQHLKRGSRVQDQWAEVEKRVIQLVGTLRWERASVHAALMIKIPALLLNWSVGAFLVGLGIYLGCTWTRKLDPSESQGSSLGTLIAYIVVTGVGLLLFFLSVLLKYLEGVPIRLLLERLQGQARPQGDADEHPATLQEARTAAKGQKPRYVRKQAKPKRRQKVDLDLFIQRLFPEIEQLQRAEEDLDEDVEANVSFAPSLHPSTSGSVILPAKAAFESEPKDFVEERYDPRYIIQDDTIPPSAICARSSIDAVEYAVDPPTLKVGKEPRHSQIDPLVAALEASILAHEQSIASIRTLLQQR